MTVEKRKENSTSGKREREVGGKRQGERGTKNRRGAVESMVAPHASSMFGPRGTRARRCELPA